MWHAVGVEDRSEVEVLRATQTPRMHVDCTGLNNAADRLEAVDADVDDVLERKAEVVRHMLVVHLEEPGRAWVERGRKL